jgi:hypothetical protein
VRGDVPLDHEFVFTITGRCARAGCAQFEDAHPKFVHGRPTDRCNVDHDAMRKRRLIGDEGDEWERCPVCLVMLEPAAAKGSPDGDATGRGRGTITNRLRARLDFVWYLVRDQRD